MSLGEDAAGTCFATINNNTSTPDTGEGNENEVAESW